MKNSEEIKLVEKLEAIVADLPEEISLEDLKRNEWLRRLVLVCDRVENQVAYRALEWTKSQ